MLGFVRSIIGFGYNKTSSDDQLLEDAFETADDSPEEETNIVDKDSEDDFENEFKDILGKGRTDDDKWDEDWMAFDEEITRDMKQLLSFDTKNCSANGVVTQIVNDQQIVINNDKTVRFDVSISLSCLQLTISLSKALQYYGLNCWRCGLC